MAIDVKEGDILVSGSDEYSIKMVDAWTLRRGGSALTRQATATYSTKRNPAISGGKRGTPVTELTGVKGTPLYPVSSSDLLQRVDLGTPYKAKQTFLYDGGSVYYHLLLEELRT
jgi:hypothetical protein